MASRKSRDVVVFTKRQREVLVGALLGLPVKKIGSTTLSIFKRRGWVETIQRNGINYLVLTKSGRKKLDELFEEDEKNQEEQEETPVSRDVFKKIKNYFSREKEVYVEPIGKGWGVIENETLISPHFNRKNNAVKWADNYVDKHGGGKVRISHLPELQSSRGQQLNQRKKIHSPSRDISSFLLGAGVGAGGLYVYNHRRQLLGNPNEKKTYGRATRDTKRETLRVCPVGTQIQSLILDNRVFDRRNARGWVKRHGFRDMKIDATENSFRFRQVEPTRFKTESFRTIRLRPGVEAVIGCPR